MPYQLKEVTIRTDNSKEGLQAIAELWQDVTTGAVPILYTQAHELRTNVSPISKYSNYASDESGFYDLSILAVEADFFLAMEEKVSAGLYMKYEEVDETDNLEACTQKAWQKVWSDQASGNIHRVYTQDYESTVPAQYTKDGKAHCFLYIAVGK